jgi:hypothetical protein
MLNRIFHNAKKLHLQALALFEPQSRASLSNSIAWKLTIANRRLGTRRPTPLVPNGKRIISFSPRSIVLSSQSPRIPAPIERVVTCMTLMPTSLNAVTSGAQAQVNQEEVSQDDCQARQELLTTESPSTGIHQAIVHHPCLQACDLHKLHHPQLCPGSKPCLSEPDVICPSIPLTGPDHLLESASHSSS